MFSKVLEGLGNFADFVIHTILTMDVNNEKWKFGEGAG